MSAAGIQAVLERARPSIRRLKAYSSARFSTTPQQLAENILLNANENPYPPPSMPELADTADFNRYPEPQPRQLLQALADTYQVAPDEVLAGRGSDEGIDLLIRAFCEASPRPEEPGDAVLICSPTFEMYRHYAEIQGCRVLDFPLEGKSYQLPVEALCGAFAQETSKICFLPNPSAPLGHLFRSADLERLLESSNRSRCVLVIDEAYAEFALGQTGYQSLIPLRKRYPNLVILRTLSKAYSLAGERLGTVIADPQLIQLLRPLQAPYPIPGSVSRYVSRLLTDPAFQPAFRRQIAEICAEREKLSEALGRLPFVQGQFPSVCNFLFVQVRPDLLPRLTAHCLQSKIMLRDFSRAIPGGLRISIGTPAENQQLLKTLSKFSPV